MSPQPVDGAKMQYLIKRRPTTSRDELIAHWYANHMPSVIARQAQAEQAGRPFARRYVASLFSEGKDASPWDGVAQLWFDEPQPAPAEPHGSTPQDSFQERAEPYLPWATREYVVIDGGERRRADPLTLDAPYPTSQSGFFKITFLVGMTDPSRSEEFFAHWLTAHATNVAAVLAEVGGWHYAISHGINPAEDRYAGMAEIFFDDAGAWRRYNELIEPDGMEAWVDPAKTVVLRSDTELVGIP